MLLLLSRFSCVQLFVIPWSVAHQAPFSRGFSRQERWNALPGDLPHPGIEHLSPAAPVLPADSLLLSHQGNVCVC